MAWKDTLLDAKYRGVALEVERVEDSGGRDVAKHRYPLANGVTTEDLGARERPINLTAIFWGDDYERQLNALLDVLAEQGPAELIHPVFGSIWVQLETWRVRHQAEDVDYAAVELSWVETGKPAALVANTSPIQLAEAALASDEPVLNAATDALDSEVGLTSMTASLEELQSLRTLMTGTLGDIQSEISGAVSTVQDVIDAPRAFASDIIDSISGVLSLARFNPGNLFAGWATLFDDAKRLGQMPGAKSGNWDRSSQGNPPSTASVRQIERFTRTSSAASLGRAAAEVLVDEVNTPTLTPPQVERLVGDSRTTIQDAIDVLRPSDDELADPAFDAGAMRLRYSPVIDALKDQALAIQTAGATVLARRPPLQQREIPFPANWHLLAHAWYGDYSRADELARLNPQVRNPNALDKGDKVTAYAQ
ncbi:DNA circularization protein [Chitinibacter sp. S2-10]|uniref:DNA circularization protein n=1 Tax=Chitinibacter sp. S2-10 TaxID=3373597 RepID=UPI0039777750